jgi:hypothetical protein
LKELLLKVSETVDQIKQIYLFTLDWNILMPMIFILEDKELPDDVNGQKLKMLS